MAAKKRGISKKLSGKKAKQKSKLAGKIAQARFKLSQLERRYEALHY